MMIMEGNCPACGKERGDYSKLAREFRYSGGEHICWLRDSKCKDAALLELIMQRDEAASERDRLIFSHDAARAWKALAKKWRPFVKAALARECYAWPDGAIDCSVNAFLCKIGGG